MRDNYQLREAGIDQLVLLDYLASPYSHPDPAMRNGRVYLASVASALLVLKGHAVVSPIVLGADMVRHFPELGLSAQMWSRQNHALQAACNRVIVLCLNGWDKSEGIAGELRIANALAQPVLYATLTASNSKILLSDVRPD